MKEWKIPKNGACILKTLHPVKTTHPPGGGTDKIQFILNQLVVLQIGEVFSLSENDFWKVTETEIVGFKTYGSAIREPNTTVAYL